MIVLISHRTGAQMRTRVAGHGVRPPAREVARAVLNLVGPAARVRVWDDGVSHLETPSADESGDTSELVPAPSVAARVLVIRLLWAWRLELAALRFQELQLEAGYEVRRPEWFREIRALPETALLGRSGALFFPRGALAARGEWTA